MKRRMTAIRGVLAGSLCLAGISGLAGCQAAPAGNVNVPSAIQVTNVEDQVISVTAKEEVKVVPDMAELNLSVTSQAADAEAATEYYADDITVTASVSMVYSIV